jgi:hypothetical protein
MVSNNDKPLGTNKIISGPAAAAGPRHLSGEILDKNQCNLLLRDVAMLKGSFSSCWRGSTVFAQMADVLASQRDATKGHRFAASPNVYQSGGRHHHNNIINKKGGENPFKILAYRKAAKVLADYPVDVKEAYRTGGVKALTAIPGIGAALSQYRARHPRLYIFYERGGGKIAEFIETGHIKKYEEVIAQKPKGE